MSDRMMEWVIGTVEKGGEWLRVRVCLSGYSLQGFSYEGARRHGRPKVENGALNQRLRRPMAP